MATKKRINVKMGRREWSRLFHTGVVKSLAKTITEPITNSDTSYKRCHSLPEDNGIIQKALSFNKGTKFDLSNAKNELKGGTPSRELEVHIYTAQGHGRKARTCEVVDFAEGMTSEEVEKAFEEYAVDKSGVSKGRPGRSLFGRGVSDVLFGHKSGLLYSLKNGQLTTAEFSFDLAQSKDPDLAISTNNNPSAAILKDIHLRKGVNGTCIRFELSDDCRIPEEGNIIPLLTQFYMLRLINSDPNINLRIFRYRSKGDILEDTIDYDFPIGDVLDNFSYQIQKPIHGADLPAMQIEGIICRSDLKTGLPGREAGDLRANGLLIVDDHDAVLDQTLLPQYENAPYLRAIFGIVRISNVRKVFEWYLNNGKDSPLTVSRDGFETRHEFTTLLFNSLNKVLEPIYRHEEERFRKGHDISMSTEAKKRMTDVLKVLNQFLDKTGEGKGEGPDLPENLLDSKKVLQFIPNRTRLYVGLLRKVSLYLRKEDAGKKSEIVFESDNPKIIVSPSCVKVSDGKSFGDYYIYEITIKSDFLHESGKVHALTETKDGVFLDTNVTITDVVAQPILNPPDEMEFRPDNAKGQPSRQHNVVLLVNSDKIPIGRKIKINLDKIHGKIVLLENNKEIIHFDIILEKRHLIPDTFIARILIPWKGTGWGQWAKISAETKLPDGTLSIAEARVDIEQPEEDAGIVRDWKYYPLENKKCSDLVNGVIYINSQHSLNNFVFGANQNSFNSITETDRTAQYRLANLVVEQAVFRKAEEQYLENKLQLIEKAPVTSLRENIDRLSDELAPKVIKILVKE